MNDPMLYETIVRRHLGDDATVTAKAILGPLDAAAEKIRALAVRAYTCGVGDGFHQGVAAEAGNRRGEQLSLADVQLDPNLRLYVRDDGAMIFVDPKGIEHKIEPETMPYAWAMRGLAEWWRQHVACPACGEGPREDKTYPHAPSCAWALELAAGGAEENA